MFASSRIFSMTPPGETRGGAGRRPERVGLFWLLLLALALATVAEAWGQPVVSYVPVSDAVFDSIALQYQYFPGTAIQASGAVAWETDAYLVEKTVLTARSDFDVPMTRIPASLAYPRSAADTPAPAILLQHSEHDSLGRLAPATLAWMDRYARQGWCVLATDFVGWGELADDPVREIWSTHPLPQRFVARQWVKYQRLALDYLLARPEVDKSAVALHGTGVGAMVGVLLAGLDDRFAAVVLVNPTHLIAGSTEDRMLRHHHPLNFAPRISAPVLLVSAAHEGPAPEKLLPEGLLPDRLLFDRLPNDKNAVWLGITSTAAGRAVVDAGSAVADTVVAAAETESAVADTVIAWLQQRLP